MALLKRELYRQVKGPEITHADRCILVFDTDKKSLSVEREVTHLEAKIGGAVEYQTAHDGYLGLSEAGWANRWPSRTVALAENDLR